MDRLFIVAMFWLLGFLLVAASAETACAQGAGQEELKRSERGATHSESPVAKRPRRSAPGPSARRRPAPAPRIAPLRPGDLAKRSLVELEKLIAAHRKVVKVKQKDETIRQNLGWISIEAANRVLHAQSLGHVRDSAAYLTMIRTTLADTVWRVTRISRTEPERATAALGLYYSDGILVAADSARGCKFFARAADLGHAAAAYRTSVCLSKTDPEKARQWLEKAAAGGDAAAQEAMGRACIEGARVDPACGKKWLEPAAAQGRVGATSVLAWLNVREGTRESLKRAAELYRAAAEAGDFVAQNNLGELLETGRGVSLEPRQALQWYRKSAESGFAAAQFNLARMLAYGIGTDRDPAAARVWAAKAQEQGIAQASELLKTMRTRKGAADRTLAR